MKMFIPSFSYKGQVQRDSPEEQLTCNKLVLRGRKMKTHTFTTSTGAVIRKVSNYQKIHRLTQRCSSHLGEHGAGLYLPFAVTTGTRGAALITGSPRPLPRTSMLGIIYLSMGRDGSVAVSTNWFVHSFSGARENVGAQNRGRRRPS